MRTETFMQESQAMSSQDHQPQEVPQTLDHALAVATRVATALRQAGYTLSAAESCTGGLIGHLITEVPGSSEYFMGSAVVYSYPAKETLVAVSPATLLEQGAVSAEVAAQMAQGARRLFATDLAVSVTGIAGPGGGLPGKPTGTTFLHLSAPNAEWGRHFVWQQDRSQNKLQSAVAALELIQEYVQENQVKHGKSDDI